MNLDGKFGQAAGIQVVGIANSGGDGGGGLRYVRFHGRNYGTWEKRGAAASERLDWYYRDEELTGWGHDTAPAGVGTGGASPVQYEQGRPGPANARRLLE